MTPILTHDNPNIIAQYREIKVDLFVSRFENKVDKKGRISLPSLFRNVLSQNNKNEIILYRSLKYNAIEGCDSKRINEIANRINKLDIFSDDQDDFSTSIFSEIIPTNIDKEGRFLIPESLKLHANISSKAIFFGQGYFFQIWEPVAALKRLQDSRMRLTKDKKTLSSIISKFNNENDQ